MNVQEETFIVAGNTRMDVYEKTLELQRSLTEQGWIICSGHVKIRYGEDDISVVVASRPVRYPHDPR